MNQLYINVDNYMLTQGVNSVVDQFFINKDKFRNRGIIVNGVIDYQNIYNGIPDRSSEGDGLDWKNIVKKILKRTPFYKMQIVETQIIRKKVIQRSKEAARLFIDRFSDGSNTIICQDAFMCYFLLKSHQRVGKTKIIYMTHIHDDEMEQYYINYPSLLHSSIGREMRDMFKYVHNNVDHIVVICQAAKRALEKEGVPSKRITVIYNSSEDCSKYLEKSEKNRDQLKFVMASSITKRKGMDLLGSAIRQVDKQLSEQCEFHIFGNGDYYPELEKEVVGLKNVMVTLYGRVKQPYRYYGDKDVFFMTSRDECLPMSIIEAMSCSLPIVSTDVGAVRELIDGNGFLMEPNIDEIAGAITSIINGRSSLELYGKKSRTLYSSKFSSDIWVDAFSELINNVQTDGKR